jgi:hypothetical protein
MEAGMFKLRKGDALKAVVLIILIIAVVAFIFVRLGSASSEISPKSAAATNAQNQQDRKAANAETPASAEMFASRTRVTNEELARAAGAPDPFRPGIVTHASIRRTSNALPSMSPLNPAADVQGTDFVGSLWLTGIVWGTQPLAAIREGDQRYFVRRGQAVPGGWKVSKISQTSVTLVKGNRRLELTITAQPPNSTAGGALPTFPAPR